LRRGGSGGSGTASRYSCALARSSSINSRHSAPQREASLFDHLIGASEDILWDFQPQRFRNPASLQPGALHWRRSTRGRGKYGSNEATPEATVAWLWGFGAGLLVGATTGVLLMYLLVVK